MLTFYSSQLTVLIFCLSVNGEPVTVNKFYGHGALWRKTANPAEATLVTLYKIQCTSKGLCVVGQKGTALSSADSGRTWQDRTSSTNTKFWLRDVSLGSGPVGFAVGSRGTILKTEDSGRNWNMLSGIPLSLHTAEK